MSLQIALQNQTTSDQVFAYVTGQAIDSGNKLFLLQADGKTPYFPDSPSSTIQPLQANCAIPLGAPGNTVYATIPHLAGARLWFVVGDSLSFFLNPGPALVEPSAVNPSDANANKNWGFCEFTFNSDQLYANISYVDFVPGIPIGLTLTNGSDQTQHVSGMSADGFQKVVSALQAQSASDGQPWGSLTFNNLRILSPNSYIGMNSGAFNGYFADYVNQAWQKYSGADLTVDTQAQWGVVKGRTANNTLSFGSGGSFAQPSAADIFSNSTGPFAGGPQVSPEQLNIGARLAAALNRSTLLDADNQPDGSDPSKYYKTSPTNHYARILHETNLDGRGYAFPYDDVVPNGGKDQSGYLSDGNPKLWTVAVGGGNATADLDVVQKRQADLVTEAAGMKDLPVADQLKKRGDTPAAQEPSAPNKGSEPAADEPKAPAERDEPKAPAEGDKPAPEQPQEPSQPTGDDDGNEPVKPKQPETPKKSFSATVKDFFAKCFGKRK